MLTKMILRLWESIVQGIMVILSFAGALITATGIIALGAVMLYFAWNWIMPSFGFPEINFLFSFIVAVLFIPAFTGNKKKHYH